MDQIIDEFVKYIYEADCAIYEENNRYHISTDCLTTNPILRIHVLNSITKWIEKIQPDSIICISEGVDEGIFGLTSLVSYDRFKPFYTYNMKETKEPLDIRSSISNCTLLLPYTHTKEQILDYLKFIENLGGHVKQVIVIVNESEHIQKVCYDKKIDLVEFCNTERIINTLKKINEPKAQKLISQLSN